MYLFETVQVITNPQKCTKPVRNLGNGLPNKPDHAIYGAKQIKECLLNLRAPFSQTLVIRCVLGFSFWDLKIRKKSIRSPTYHDKPMYEVWWLSINSSREVVWQYTCIKSTNLQTRQKYRRTDGLTDRQTNKQTNILTDRQTFWENYSLNMVINLKNQ